jgi:hypothetical protein
MTIEVSTDHLREPVATLDTVMACLSRLQDGAPSSEARERDSDQVGKTVPLSRVVELAAALGFRAERVELDWAELKATGFTHPVLVLRKDNDVVIVTGGGRAGAEEVSVWDPHHDGVVFFVPREDFERHWSGDALIINAAEPQPTVSAVSTPPGVSDFEKRATPTNPEEALKAVPPSPEASAPRLSWHLAFSLVSIAIAVSFGFGASYFVNRELPATHAEPSATEVSALLTRGDALFSSGDLPAARLVYERAANAGNGQAAIRLGETFDPGFLEHARLIGARGDRNTALFWYRRAGELGATEAEPLLQSLEAEKDQ